MTDRPDGLVDFLEHLADEVGPRHREVFHLPPEVTIKEDGSPVTKIDVETEDRLRAAIEARWPDHGILGEERPTRNPDAEWMWIIDPIDGTKSYLAEIPMYTVLIAVARRGRLEMGVIDQPILQTRWIGGRGLPTRRGSTAVSSRGDATLEDAFLVIGSIDHFGADGPRIDRLTSRVRHTIVGRDSYLPGLLASGRLDAIVIDNMNLYDYAALVPVVEGAGGVVLDRHGAPVTMDPPDLMIFAANARLGEQIVEVLGTD